MKYFSASVLASSLLCISSTTIAADLTTYDLVIQNAIVYDGTGAAPQSITIAVNGDRVVAHLPNNAKFNAKKIASISVSFKVIGGNKKFSFS